MVLLIQKTRWTISIYVKHFFQLMVGCCWPTKKRYTVSTNSQHLWDCVLSVIWFTWAYELVFFFRAIFYVFVVAICTFQCGCMCVTQFRITSISFGSPHTHTHTTKRTFPLCFCCFRDSDLFPSKHCNMSRDINYVCFMYVYFVCALALINTNEARV